MALPWHSTALVSIPGLSLLAIFLYEANQIVPQSAGVRDDPSNMQWLPREQHREKAWRHLGR